ncbi:MAG: ribonuclease HII [bacterium]|nr:ribonuclease HII [bacterium]
MKDWSALTVDEIGAALGGEPPPEGDLAALEADPRAGARGLAAALRRRMAARREEAGRIERMLEREHSLWARGVSYVAGVDEVGVGPFAGPVVAAAVIFPRGVSIPGVRDSKVLTHERRVALDARIREAALSVGIGAASNGEIDRLDILRASLEAMRRALLDLEIAAEHVLVDGRHIPGIGAPQEAIVDGDATIFSVAAASIVAKVHRDRIMLRYDRLYPRYGFARNKGYGTAEHIRALREHGPCAIHRRSFDWRRARAVSRPSAPGP